jgi:hypothetical protein
VNVMKSIQYFCTVAMRTFVTRGVTRRDFLVFSSSGLTSVDWKADKTECCCGMVSQGPVTQGGVEHKPCTSS